MAGETAHAPAQNEEERKGTRESFAGGDDRPRGWGREDCRARGTAVGGGKNSAVLARPFSLVSDPSVQLRMRGVVLKIKMLTIPWRAVSVL